MLPSFFYYCTLHCIMSCLVGLVSNNSKAVIEHSGSKLVAKLENKEVWGVWSFQ